MKLDRKTQTKLFLTCASLSLAALGCVIPPPQAPTAAPGSAASIGGGAAAPAAAPPPAAEPAPAPVAAGPSGPVVLPPGFKECGPDGVLDDPDGGVCTECFNDFGGDLSLTPEWKLYIYPWKSMKQMPGWGNPRKPHVNQAKIYGIQFQVNVPSANYDIYVDDLKFICQ